MKRAADITGNKEYKPGNIELSLKTKKEAKITKILITGIILNVNSTFC